jgi:IMP cyclohydrolase
MTIGWIIFVAVILVLLVVIPTMRMSSMCSREEERNANPYDTYTVGHCERLHKIANKSVVIDNGHITEFVEEKENE